MSKKVIDLPVLNPLRQQVTDILRTAISRCQFEPGGRLTERELCEMLNVSRSTVRESLRQLETEGLVRITPNKGPMITALTETEARELYAIRTQLESYATAAFANNAGAHAIERLEEHLANMQTAVEDENFDDLQSHKTQFYNTLFEGSGNQQLAVMLKQLRARNALIRGADHNRNERMRESVRGAEAVLRAVRNGDATAAAEASKTHLAHASEMAIDALRSVNQVEFAS
jgi:DNA-binding GntR family transcriptional regulator